MDKYEEVHEQINSLQALLRRFDELKLSTMEFAYLKLIAFTSTGKGRSYINALFVPHKRSRLVVMRPP